MDVLATAKAAEQLGVNVQRFHRLVAKHGIKPVLEGARDRPGPMFWLAADIEPGD